jgi:hypothetical protein
MSKLCAIDNKIKICEISKNMQSSLFFRKYSKAKFEFDK